MKTYIALFRWNGLDYMAEFSVSAGEKSTHESPGCGPSVEIDDLRDANWQAVDIEKLSDVEMAEIEELLIQEVEGID